MEDWMNDEFQNKAINTLRFLSAVIDYPYITFLSSDYELRFDFLFFHFLNLLFASQRADSFGSSELIQSFERRIYHCHTVVRTERFRENVLHARDLEDRAHGAAGDDARSRGGRLEQHARGAEHAQHLVRDRALHHRDAEHVLHVF